MRFSILLSLLALGASPIPGAAQNLTFLDNTDQLTGTVLVSTGENLAEAQAGLFFSVSGPDSLDLTSLITPFTYIFGSGTSSISVSLYNAASSGFGLEGDALASKSMSYAAPVAETNWVEFDLNGLTLESGNRYAMILSADVPTEPFMFLLWNDIDGKQQLGTVSTSSHVSDLSAAFTTDGGASWQSSGAHGMLLTGTTSAVPEPSTYALMMGASIFGFIAWRRRRGNPAGCQEAGA